MTQRPLRFAALPAGMMPVAGCGSATPATSGHPKAYAEPVTSQDHPIYRNGPDVNGANSAALFDSEHTGSGSSTVDEVLIRLASSDETG